MVWFANGKKLTLDDFKPLLGYRFLYDSKPPIEGDLFGLQNLWIKLQSVQGLDEPNGLIKNNGN